MSIDKTQIGIVIPYYNAANKIAIVVNKALKFSDRIVIVDDQSPESLPEALFNIPEITVVKSPNNLGVGGATKIGFEYLQSVHDIKVIVKLDADNQMNTEYIPEMVGFVLSKGYQLVKGNRFRDLKVLKKMPALRRFGNLWLSFLSKAATGYWNCFDFNNGYFAISTKTLRQTDKSTLSNGYFFETSLIASLYFQKAVVKEIAMPAIYDDEKSNMKLVKMPFLFSSNLIKLFCTRIWRGYFVYEFNIATIYLLFGFLLFLGGVLFGSYNWYHYSSTNTLAPLGTIMISTLLIILGFQLLLQAVQFDILNTPNKTENE